MSSLSSNSALFPPGTQRRLGLMHALTQPTFPRLPPLLPPLTRLQVGKQQLKAITKRFHIRILVLLQLKRLRNNFDGPALQFRVQTGFEAEMEVAGVFGVDAEGVVAAFGVRFRVGCEPALWLGFVSFSSMVS